MHILSKSTYIKGLQCEKALYMQKKHPYLRDKLSIEQRAKFQRGTDVGVLAHEVFPGGIDMSPNSPSQFPKKAAETWQNLNNPEVNVMYEAVFQYNDTLIMLDMLVRDGDQWLAVEVKSSMRLSDTYYNDAALQYYVLHGCGVPLSDFRLMYLNPDYVKNGSIDVKQLFKMESVMDYVIDREAFVAKNVERLKKVVALPHSPLVNIGTQCNDPYPCDFQGHCWKLIPKNSFLFTTAMDDDELFNLYFNGVNSNAKMLSRLDSDSIEAHQVEALETNSYYIDYKTLYTLAPQPKPKSIAYLNLLLHRPAVPEIDGTKPYEELILAFALQGEHEPKGCFVWDCFENHGLWKEAVDILIEKLSHYELIVCFTPQNLTTTLLRHEIIQNKEVGYKVFNLFDVLQQVHFYHPAIKRGLTLQRLETALFSEPKLFEHSRILLEATSNDLIGYQQAREDLVAENEIVAKTYQHLFK
ncbi:MAG: hypothetical protein IKD78_02855 [Bacteroidales bacterium]|nr:hypothetical protein [Bacteroidales bacterium]MBR6931290.1 hypothetical protein [Bacteroidales bacterium]